MEGCASRTPTAARGRRTKFVAKRRPAEADGRVRHSRPSTVSERGWLRGWPFHGSERPGAGLGPRAGLQRLFDRLVERTPNPPDPCDGHTVLGYRSQHRRDGAVPDERPPGHTLLPGAGL